jgi:hypothetical protein
LTIDLKVSERLEIFERQFDSKRAFVAASPIAFDAAGKALAIAVISMSRPSQQSHCILATLLNDPRLLPKRD